MSQIDRIPTPTENAKQVLARRQDALALLEAARAKGEKKEAAALERLIRQYDKLVSDYRMNRHASRT